VGVDGSAVLIGNQNVVHQGHGQVRGHQGGSGGNQGADEARQELLAVGLGKAPEAEQGPGGRGLLQFPGAGRAFVLAGHQGGVATGTALHLGHGGRHPGQEGLALALIMDDQAAGGGILAQGIGPAGNAAAGFPQLQLADAALVLALQFQPGAKVPGLPGGILGEPHQQPLAGDHGQAPLEVELFIQVQFQPGNDLFTRFQAIIQVGQPICRHIVRNAFQKGLLLFGVKQNFPFPCKNFYTHR